MHYPENVMLIRMKWFKLNRLIRIFCSEKMKIITCDLVGNLKQEEKKT